MISIRALPSNAAILPADPAPQDGATNQLGAILLSWTARGENLLLNGGFEAGLGSGWTVENSGAAQLALLRGSSSGEPVPFKGAVSVGFSRALTGTFNVLSQTTRLPTSSAITLQWAEFLREDGFTSSGEVAEFRVEIWEKSRNRLSIVYSTKRFEFSPVFWNRRAVDLSEFAGQEVTIAFVLDASERSTGSVLTFALDDVRLSGWPEQAGVFNVYLGTNAVLDDSTLLGRTAGLTWTIAKLSRNKTYYWRVASGNSTNLTLGPTWSFSTRRAAAVLDHFALSSASSWGVAGEPLPVTFTALDEDDKTFSGSITATSAALAALGGAQDSSVVITEVDPGATNAVEFMNVSTQPVELSGWQAYFYSSSYPSGSPSLSGVFRFPAGSVCQPGEVFTVRSRSGPGQYPNFGMATGNSGFGWRSGANPYEAGVVMTDALTNSVDVFLTGSMSRRTLPKPGAPLSEWQSSAVPVLLVTNFTWQRIGTMDRDNREDWVLRKSTLGQVNSDLSPLFEPKRRSLSVQPLALGWPSRPQFTTNILFSEAATHVELLAEVRSGNLNVNRYCSLNVAVSAVPILLLSTNTVLLEGGDPQTNALSIRLSNPLATNLLVELGLTPAGAVAFVSGGSVTIPAGSSEVVVGLVAPADNKLEGSHEVTVTAAAPGFICSTATFEVIDAQIASLTWQAPAEIIEGQNASATLFISQPPDTDVRVGISSSDPGLIGVPPFIWIPAGSNSVAVPIASWEDFLLTGSRLVEIKASVAGWPEATASITHRDNEPAALALLLPDTVSEGAAPLTNGGVLLLPGTLDHDLAVNLQSSDLSRLSVPATVIIPAGETAAHFTLGAPDNSEMDGAASVRVTAAAPEFTSGEATVRVLDNDPASVGFSPIPNPQIAGQPFVVSAEAFDSQGQTLGGLTAPLTLTATNSGGASIPTSVNPVMVFTNGKWGGQVMIGAAAAGLRLVATSSRPMGASSAFNVLRQPVLASTNLLSFDIAWDATRERLMASVAPDDPAFSNQIVLIDPVTGAATDSFATSGFEYPPVLQEGTLIREGRLLIDGNLLYVTVQGGRNIECYDLSDHHLVRTLKVSTPENGGVVADLRLVPGRPGMVLVGLTEGTTGLGLKLFTPTGASNYGAAGTGATLLVPDTVPGRVFGNVENTPFPWWIYDISEDGTISDRYTYSPIMVWTGNDAILSDREIIVARGAAINVESFQVTGKYPVQGAMKWDWMMGNTGRIAFDQTTGRVFILTLEENSYSPNQWLQVFDHARRELIRDLRIPAPGNAQRLLILTNGLLAFNTHSGVFVLRSPWLLASEPLARLQLEQTASPAQPHPNQEFALTLSITNLGPDLAQDLVLETQFPTNHQFLGASADAGSWQYTNSTVRWQQLSLAIGALSTVSIRLRATLAGPFTNTVRFLTTTWNPVLPNGLTNYVTSILPDENPLRLDLVDWRLRFNASPSHEYQLEHAPTLHGPWSSLGSPLSGQQGSVEIPIQRGDGPDFFRVRIQ